MIIHNVRQNSVEWHQLRLGIPTASEFHKILTPTGKRSTQAEAYRNRLLAEWVTGAPLENVETQWMERGHDLEEQAVDAYEFATGKQTQVVGFVTTDDGRIGCSPDRLVGDDGGLELKCPAPWTHIGYLLSKTVADDYKVQVQGCMLLCQRAWWDVVSFCPGMPVSVVHIEADVNYMVLLDEALAEFCASLEAARKELTERYGVKPKPKVSDPKVEDPLGITEDDMRAILDDASKRRKECPTVARSLR